MSVHLQASSFRDFHQTHWLSLLFVREGRRLAGLRACQSFLFFSSVHCLASRTDETQRQAKETSQARCTPVESRNCQQQSRPLNQRRLQHVCEVLFSYVRGPKLKQSDWNSFSGRSLPAQSHLCSTVAILVLLENLNPLPSE